MLKFAADMEFEKAAEIRDKIKELEKISKNPWIIWINCDIIQKYEIIRKKKGRCIKHENIKKN